MTDAAVRVSVDRLDTTEALLAGVVPASTVVADLGPRRFLHSGPPLSADQMPGPMRGAVIGALLFEESADSIEEAEGIVRRGEIDLVPCATVGGVGAMAGVVSSSMPVVVATDRSGEIRAFSPINEGLGSALRFGSHSPAVIDRLVWLRNVAAPMLDRAVGACDGINLSELQAEGLRRGDECHNRNVASSTALLLRLAPVMARNREDLGDLAEVISTLSANPHFFLSFSMASAKVVALAAAGIPSSPLVVAITSNGVELGIQVSGTGNRWFTAPAPLGQPRLFEGFDVSDAQPAMGESFITEVIGLGACALGAAPAITAFIGGDQARAKSVVNDWRAICASSSSRFLVPFDDFTGTPLGIDVTRVAAAGIAPTVNNGFAHRQPGIGQVGAGLTRLPLEPFLAADAALASQQPAPTHSRQLQDRR